MKGVIYYKKHHNNYNSLVFQRYFAIVQLRGDVMNRKNKIIESAIGFVPMFLLWLIGSLAYKNFYVDMFTNDKNEIHIGAIVPMIVLCIMPVWLQIFAIIGKAFNLKLMYVFAAIGMGLPAAATILSDIFSNDGNILSWIFAFTIGLPLIPFGRIAFSAFEGADSFSYIYMNRFLEYNEVCRIYLFAIVISVFLFLIIKTKKDVLEKSKI